MLQPPLPRTRTSASSNERTWHPTPEKPEDDPDALLNARAAWQAPTVTKWIGQPVPNYNAMTRIHMTAGGLGFVAETHPDAPKTVAAFWSCCRTARS